MTRQASAASKRQAPQAPLPSHGARTDGSSSGGQWEAADGLRTHDLLHGKPAAACAYTGVSGLLKRYSRQMHGRKFPRIPDLLGWHQRAGGAQWHRRRLAEQCGPGSSPEPQPPCSAPAVASNREIVGQAWAGSDPHRDDLSVPLECDAVCPPELVRLPEPGGLSTIAGEAPVERAADGVAGQGEGRASALSGGASNRDNLAIALEHNPARTASSSGEARRLLAVTREARVEQPIGVVAGEREIGPGDSGCAADHDNPPGLLRCYPGSSVATSEVGGLLAVAREARVEQPIGVVAGQGEVARGPPIPDRHDLAGRLNRHAGGPIRVRESSRLLAVAGEARVERAVGVVADKCEARGHAPAPDGN